MDLEPLVRRAIQDDVKAFVESLEACEQSLDGVHDDLPIDAFAFAGSIAEIRGRARS